MEDNFRIEIELQSEWLASCLDADLPRLRSDHASGLTTDSRLVQKNDVFVALRGDSTDGHHYLDDAFARGALVAVTDKPVRDKPCLVVKNTTKALGVIAANWRAHFDLPIIGITGSNGKTTTKEMVGSILSQAGNPLTSWRNWNNLIGTPLTLLRLKNDHTHAVLELGMNDFGEMRELGWMSSPTIRLITNIGPVHLEKLGNVHGVLRAKLELYESLHPDDMIVVNADDELLAEPSMNMTCEKVVYSMDPNSTSAEVKLKKIIETTAEGSHFCIDYGSAEVDIHLDLPGRYNIQNAIAAAAAVFALDMPKSFVQEGLEHLSLPPNRSKLVHFPHDVIVIDDCYNANPVSMRVALETAADIEGKRKICILGDMLELGQTTGKNHREIIQLAQALGFEFGLLFGAQFVQSYQEMGQSKGFYASTDKASLKNQLHEILRPGDVILIKGSRGMRMEEFIEDLKQQFRSETVAFGRV